MDADSGKSQDNHTCGMTNALPGHTLTFACFISLYVVFMEQLWKLSETMSFLCLDSVLFTVDCGQGLFVVKAESLTHDHLTMSWHSFNVVKKLNKLT